MIHELQGKAQTQPTQLRLKNCVEMQTHTDAGK